MGNLCGKESRDSDPFAQPGRTLNSAPPSHPAPTSSLPRKVGGPPRTLGGGKSSQSQDQGQEDARRRAAEAAEARAQAANKSTGKLGNALLEQKKQSRSDTLKAVSDEQRRQREIDQANEARNYN